MSDCLVQPIILAIADIKLTQDNSLKTCIKNVRLIALSLNHSRPSQNQPLNIRLIISNKMLCSQLTNFPNIIVSLLLTNTRKTQSRLTTTTMLLRQLDIHPLQNFLIVSLQSSIKHTVTINNNKPKLLIIVQDFPQRLRVKRCLTAVSECVDWLKRFNIDSDFLFSFTVTDFNHTAEEN